MKDRPKQVRIEPAFGPTGLPQTSAKDPQIERVWVGAIHMQAEIESFQSTPNFLSVGQPLRCYLVGYDKGRFILFWSKPDEHGYDGTFVTNIMKEDYIGNDERYFNDAHRDAYHYDASLTLTRHQAFGGRAFVYRQQFDGWIGAFTGHLDPIEPKKVPLNWIDVFHKGLKPNQESSPVLSYVIKNNTSGDFPLEPGEAWQFICRCADEQEACEQMQKVKISSQQFGHSIMNVYFGSNPFDARSWSTNGSSADDFPYDDLVTIGRVLDETKS